MGDESEVTYRDGDIVWVKLGSIWWPGEVIDRSKVPEDIVIRKDPIAVVKFFEEDSYEIVKTSGNIYFYNCSKKNDFIRKGMVAFKNEQVQAENSPLKALYGAGSSRRSKGEVDFDGSEPLKLKQGKMDNFPKHVCIAETMTGGNPDILSDPEVVPQKKATPAATIFGPPVSLKKKPKGTPGRKSKGGRKSNPFPDVRHRRFLGYDDHEVRILIQKPPQEEETSSSDSDQMYKCQQCSFKTPRVEVIMMHKKTHLQGGYTPRFTKPSSPRKGTQSHAKKSPVKRPRKLMTSLPRTKTSTIDEDIELLQKGLSIFEDKTDVIVEKQKPVASEPVKKEQNKETILKSILCEWENDFDDDDNEEKAGSAKSELSEATKKDDEKETSSKPADNSCFDFNEEEESEFVTAASGRKIPRVIPETKEKTPQQENNDVEFMELMETTAAPKIPEIPSLLKCEQNFHDDATIKFPDKPELPDPPTPTKSTSSSVKEVATKLTNPKKRFVKSFEDFTAKYLQQDAGESNNENKDEEKVDDQVEKNSDSSTKQHKEVTQEIVQDVIKDVLEDAEKKDILSNKRTENITAEDSLTKSAQEQSSSNTENKRKSPVKLLRSPVRSPERKGESDSENTKRKAPLKLHRSPLGSPTRQDGNSGEEKQTIHEGKKSPVGSPEKSSTKQDDRELRSKSPLKSPQKKRKEPTNKVPTPEMICKRISERLQGSSLNRFFKLHDETESSKAQEKTEDTTVEVSKLKTQLMSKLSSKDETKTSKRNISEVIGATDPQTSSVENVLPKYNKGKYKSRIYQMSEGNSGLHVAKKRAVTSFEDFLEKKPPVVSKEKEPEKLKEKEKIDDKNKPEVFASQQPEKSTSKTDQESISEEVPMDIETEVLPTTSFETNPPATTATTSQVDISALTTLATVSELSTTLEPGNQPKPPTEPELITLDKAVTIVSEKELAVEVEFANDSVAKPLTLSSFSMDFADSNSENASLVKEGHTSPVKENKNKGDESSVEVTVQNKTEEKGISSEKSVVKIPQQDLSNFDIEEQIPPSIVMNVEQQPQKVAETTAVKPEKEQTTTSAKLLEVLNDRQKKKENVNLEPKKTEMNIKTKIVSISPKGLIKQPQVKKQQIQEQKTDVENVSVKKVSSVRDYEDIEDIDKFIIQKKPSVEQETEPVVPSVKKPLSKPGGKAKILQQTIITPAGDIIHPEPPQDQKQGQIDDNIMFDINSMPIVLGDQILQPENADSLPVVISDSPSKVIKPTEKTILIKKPNQQQPQQMKLLNKGIVKTTTVKSPATQTYVKVHPSQIKGGIKNQKVYQIGQKIVKTGPALLSQQGKQGKFIIVPSTSSPIGTKAGVEKRMTITKKLPGVSPKQVVTKVQNIAPEPTGNKIMIVTNQQGQQSRVVLTPAQQKLFGYQPAGSKTKTAIIKGSPTIKTTDAASSNISPKTVVQQRQFITSSGQIVTTPVSRQQVVLPKKVDTSKMRKTPVQTQRVIIQNVVTTPKGTPTTTKTTTAVIRNQQQPVKKMQQVDEALLDQQVQEQLQAIRASGLKSQQIRIEPLKTTLPKQPAKRSYIKKQPIESKPTIVTTKPTATTTKAVTKADGLPPLAPISPKKLETSVESTKSKIVEEQTKIEVPQRPLNQLIIQDAQGNQTTITEGQILALPSETVDGQPSTYMLVTLDETGNLTPLNNEALMSLDPNLGLGGDLSNMVLQLDAGNATLQPQQQVVSEPVQKPKETVAVVTQQQELVVKPEMVAPVVEKPEVPAAVVSSLPATQEPVVDPNQQFYVADPATAQKLIESLSESNADFASLLANAENNSILINADGQQILINANTDNQVLLTVNTDSTPEAANSIFATQPTKSQDILAAALADTDVFQQDQAQVTKVSQAQLSPNNTLYPMNVGNVLETSLTLTSPIMTPLEVPSTNNKKIPDEEADILTQVPKNVDLPITITDPNISQTVSQQQVASLIANELQGNLELPLAISDANIVVVTSELSSPSYGYSLPSLDDNVDINQKGFASSISMPLLSEDSREGAAKTDDSNQSLENPTSKSDEIPVESKLENKTTDEKSNKKRKLSNCEDSDMMAEGLCTLGGEMCSSLSEPPPDMFDLTVVSAPFMSTNIKNTDDIPETCPKTSENNSNVPEETIRKSENDIFNPYGNCRNENIVPSATSDLNMDENSCEIPLQPEIVTDLSSKTFDLNESVQNEGLKRDCEEDAGNERKRIRAD